MNGFTRWWEVARREFLTGARRPAYWILLFLMGFLALGLSDGSVTIASGGGDAGDPHLTSVFGQSRVQAVMLISLGALFLAIISGLTVIRDLELKVGEVFHATRLTPREYVWGKFWGGVAVFALIWLLYLFTSIGFNHIVESGRDHIGPFSLENYLFPTLLFGLPQVLLFAGVPFLIGTWTRRPLLVFLFPMVALLLCFTVLTTWSPTWLSPEVNRALMLIDPSGFRWLNETFLTVDRGVDFYNTSPLYPDAGFLVSRLVFAVTGLGAVAGAAAAYERRLRVGGSDSRFMRLFRRPRRAHAAAAPVPEASLRGLGMATRPLGFRKAALAITRSEVRDLVARPPMYFFVPLILVQAISETTLGYGFFGSRILITPGAVAEQQLNTLSLLVCFLLLFYTVESLSKERNRHMHEIFHSAPVGTGAMLLGKTMGNAVMAGLILVAALVSGAGIILYHQLFNDSPVGYDLYPFIAMWGGVLLPTFIFWTALVTALFSLLRNRFAAYGAGLAILVYTIFRQQTEGTPGWLGNWQGRNFVLWSDMGAFSLHGTPILLNRLLYLSLVPLLVAVSIRWFPRRDFDATETLNRTHPRRLALGALRLLPLAIVPVVLGSVLYAGGRSGYQRSGAGEWRGDYWEQNFAIWNGSEMPSVSHVDLDLVIEPSERSVAVTGAYTFLNHRDYAFDELPITAGSWHPFEWTLAGESHEPEDRSGLFIFTLEEPLAPGDTVTVGFSYDLALLEGMSRRPGGASQFILESGVVLDGFSLTFAPVPGYDPDIGARYFEEPEVEDDFYEGETEPLIGWAGKPFTVRTRIDIPEEYTANGVGQVVSDEVGDGRRTVVWETDHPVRMFNVIAGKYDVIEGDGTAIHHHPGHHYNVEEMSAALDAARRYYSEWFHPFPWSVLKLSEMPAFSGGAQGFPTNITFSEGMGFLTRRDPRSHLGFMVVAHEAAHQWWGNLLGPGRGPGGNVLSEGMSHYATTLLHEQVYGDRYRIEFTKRMEEEYVRRRRVDTERAMARSEGGFYNKGAWAMWMLQQEMGRDNILAGLRAFIGKYLESPDHPVIPDMLAVLRDFAPDTAAFDALTGQWFFEVVLPEYRLSDVTKVREGDEWVVRGTVENVGTGRMRVEVGAVAGERWSDEGDDGGRSVVAEGYRDARAVVVPGAGEVAEFVIRAGFEPERMVIDPDVLVQGGRGEAVFEW
ncbi:MAG: M1 family aminopeptidase [Gemmatimonadota bacterium]|nr:M1 family aminopeptidase [Gemmatimonadota bacterium]